MIVAKTTVLAAALSIIAMLSMATAGQAFAETSDSGIATWVDGNGITHFGNSQFAPANASPVDVAPANGMDVPAAVSFSSRQSRQPSMVAIKKKPNRQTKGWRGFAGYRKTNPNRPAGNR